MDDLNAALSAGTATCTLDNVSSASRRDSRSMRHALTTESLEDDLWMIARKNLLAKAEIGQLPLMYASSSISW